MDFSLGYWIQADDGRHMQAFRRQPTHLPGMMTREPFIENLAGMPDADAVRICRLPALRVIKVSFPRPVVQGSFTDHDVHSGQQYLPLAKLRVTTGGTR